MPNFCAQDHGLSTLHVLVFGTDDHCCTFSVRVAWLCHADTNQMRSFFLLGADILTLSGSQCIALQQWRNGCCSRSVTVILCALLRDCVSCLPPGARGQFVTLWQLGGWRLPSGSICLPTDQPGTVACIACTAQVGQLCDHVWL